MHVVNQTYNQYLDFFFRQGLTYRLSRDVLRIAAELNSYVSLPSDGVTMSKAPQARILTAFENTPACQANPRVSFLLTRSHYIALAVLKLTDITPASTSSAGSEGVPGTNLLQDCKDDGEFNCSKDFNRRKILSVQILICEN